VTEVSGAEKLEDIKRFVNIHTLCGNSTIYILHYFMYSVSFTLNYRLMFNKTDHVIFVLSGFMAVFNCVSVFCIKGTRRLCEPEF